MDPGAGDDVGATVGDDDVGAAVGAAVTWKDAGAAAAGSGPGDGAVGSAELAAAAGQLLQLREGLAARGVLNISVLFCDETGRPTVSIDFEVRPYCRRVGGDPIVSPPPPCRVLPRARSLRRYPWHRRRSRRGRPHPRTT